MDHPGPLTVLVYAVAPPQLDHGYLLLRRIQSRGGFWQAIRVNVGENEALDEAAVRGLAKQTALAPIRLLAVDYSYTLPASKRATAHSPQPQHIKGRAFLALLSAKVDPNINAAEHDAWDWFAYEDALMWLRSPEETEALRRCEGLIPPGPPDRRP